MKKVILVGLIMLVGYGKSFANNNVYQLSVDTMTVGHVVVGTMTVTTDISTNMTVTGALVVPTGTLSALQALTTVSNQLAYCSDCSLDALCVTTGTIHSFVKVSSRTITCQ